MQASPWACRPKEMWGGPLIPARIFCAGQANPVRFVTLNCIIHNIYIYLAKICSFFVSLSFRFFE